jgi:hypothetical protein
MTASGGLVGSSANAGRSSAYIHFKCATLESFHSSHGP